MKKIAFLTLLFLLYSIEEFSQPIIADHTVVDRYDDIPQYYINEVKKMWVSIAGESHSAAYRQGPELLESIDSKYQVEVQNHTGTPASPTTQYLRISRATWGDVENETGWIYGYGEEDFYTSTTAISRTKASLTYSNSGTFDLAVFGFGWCWDATWQNAPGGGYDPVYYTRWAGASVGGPQGNLRWGLDADDFALTGNTVCMDTYLKAVDEYIKHCKDNGLKTVVIFTTGPIDNAGQYASGEWGYQQYLKHKYTRDYVKGKESAYLFDFADILSYNDSNVPSTTSWTDSNGTLQTFPIIHPDNLQNLQGVVEEEGYHFGEKGGLRIAKALWWLLARIAGWDGVTTGISDTPEKETTNIVVDSSNGEINIYSVDGFIGGYINLYNISGCLLQRQTIISNQSNISTSDVAPGLYFVELRKSSFRAVKKVLLLNKY